jgi:5'-deoxynucleotidase YfbR-like HD superfamily hydrolase
MTAIETTPFIVIKRFPDHKKTLKRLFRESEIFQSICEDYVKCADALNYWNQSDSEEAAARREEYDNLLQNLELEILQILNESN